MNMTAHRFLILALALTIVAAVIGLTPGLTAPAEAASASHTCKPADVAAFPERVHVRCEQGVGGVVYFAAPTANSAHAARILAVLLVARASDRSVRVEYDTAVTSGAAFGCDPSNCRRLLSVAL